METRASPKLIVGKFPAIPNISVQAHPDRSGIGISRDGEETIGEIDRDRVEVRRRQHLTVRTREGGDPHR